MSNQMQQTRQRPTTLRTRVQSMAGTLLLDMVGEDRAREAAARVGMAFAAAHRAARNPRDIEKCSTESIAAAVAMSALTGLMPGGAMPSVWLVPRGGNLQWMISHRGLMTLCRRAGYQITAACVGPEDHIRIEYGEVVEHTASPGNEPSTLRDLTGVIVSCRRLSDGVILGRYWMSGADIRKRAAKGGPVWQSWPMEMASKSAVKWACARGYVPIESIELDQALSADTKAEAATAPTPATKTTRLSLADLQAAEPEAEEATPEPEVVEAEIIPGGAA